MIPMFPHNLVQLVGRALDLWSKSCEFESLQEWWENFLLLDVTLCADLFGVHSTPVLPQWPVKDLVILQKVQIVGYS